MIKLCTNSQSIRSNGFCQYKNRIKYIPRIGNGLVWTVSVDDGNILCDAVGDIALEIVLDEKYALGVASDAMVHVLYSIKKERDIKKRTRIWIHVKKKIFLYYVYI